MDYAFDDFDRPRFVVVKLVLLYSYADYLVGVDVHPFRGGRVEKVGGGCERRVREPEVGAFVGVAEEKQNEFLKERTQGEQETYKAEG